MKKITELLIYTDDSTSDYSLSQDGVKSLNYAGSGPFIIVSVEYTDGSHTDFVHPVANITFMEVVQIDVADPPLPPPPPPTTYPHLHPATPTPVIGGING